MRLLERNGAGEIRLTKFFVSNVPRYAILSHTWGNEEEEVSFQDLMDGTGKNKLGYRKIQFCGEQAWRDGLEFFWVDTCCINKSNSTELQEAINSMFRWYRDAAKCYVYLADVSTPSLISDDNSSWEPAFRNSRWFTRGWTLQELIAPLSVEFFSKEGVLLGTRRSLERHIHEITGIPVRALRGSPLSQFSISDRLAWIEKRDTTRKEDKAYALLGIFDIHMSLIYGEGENNAFRRLREEINKASIGEQAYHQVDRCLADLRCTDPRHDKTRIEQTKGGLLADSYRWVLDNKDFRRWQENGQSRLLWIKGDPGKGKTMLLCGIINELKSTCNFSLLSFFFCQATDASINNATAVLRGLIYLLVDQQPSLISHVQKKYDPAGNPLFRDVNAWIALSEIFTGILEDPSLPRTCLIVDALDECTKGLDLLLELIVKTSSAYSSVKWIVSSRNWSSIEKDLDAATQKVKLCLELNEESVTAAVTAYVQSKVDWLAKQNGYNTDTRDAVERYFSANAQGTFLWVALVCQELANTSEWEAEELLTTFPPGLDALYGRMMDQIYNSRHAKLLQRILAVISVVYRPITLDELPALVDIPDRASGNDKALAEIVGLCGSFLTLRERKIFFVHQSAKEFLLKQARDEIFPTGMEDTHYTIFSRSLRAARKILRRDIYSLGAPGFPIDRVKPPDPDPLAAVQYSCVHWINHLRDCNPKQNRNKELQDGELIDTFLREKYLHWLEALSLLKAISEGTASMIELERLFKEGKETSLLANRVRDAYRFILYHKWAIKKSPLQVYASALIFSPAHSIIRKQFENEGPKWIIRKPAMADNWNACLQTLEGHSSLVNSVAWSHDATRLASASHDKRVKIWDPATGKCVSTLEGHSDAVRSVSWSHDATMLASGSDDKTIKIWDPATGQCVSTLEGHSDAVRSVSWSHAATWLASGSDDRTIKIWDPATGQGVSTLGGHSDSVGSVAWSHDAARIASASDDNTVKIWDPVTGRCVWTLEGHRSLVGSVAWSHDATLLASASDDETVKIWDPATGQCVSTLDGHRSWVRSVAWSHDATRLASASGDGMIKIWDPATGQCVWTLEGHRSWVRLVAWSRDATLLASASGGTIKIWDPATGQCVSMLEIDYVLYDLQSNSGLLRTEFGVFDLRAIANSTVLGPASAGCLPPIAVGYGLSSNGTWITYQGENLLWLPPEYRPSSSDISGTAMSIGCPSGRVLIFTFSDSNPIS
ncbi:hypothetical protein VTK56DRAFT_8957 [Thermocarpiscus australiensis]